MRTEESTEQVGGGGPAPSPAHGRRVTVLVLLLMGLVGSLWVIGPLVFAGRDDPTAIDHKAVRRAVLAACGQLGDDLAAVPSGATATVRAEAENRAVERLVAGVRSLGAELLAKDAPVEEWLGDWEALVAARRQAVRDGERLVVPNAGGAPVNVRMFALTRAGLRDCDVPARLLVPEPGRV